MAVAYEDFANRFCFLARDLTEDELLVIHCVWEMVVGAMQGNDGSHDHEHVYRVTKNAYDIWKDETTAESRKDAPRPDLMVCTLGALLHDWVDRKLMKPGDDPAKRLEELGDLLEHGKGLAKAVTNKVIRIAANISYSKRMAGTSERPSLYDEFPEFFIVEDADYLDALGPVGQLRCAMLAGRRNHPIRNDATPSIRAYLSQGKKLRSPLGDVTYMDHFQHKLLLLGDIMSTETGRSRAKVLTISNVAHLLALEAALQGAGAYLQQTLDTDA